MTFSSICNQMGDVDLLFAGLGLLMSLVYAIGAPYLFVPLEERAKWTRQEWWHQRWFNFAGSAAGWVIIWTFARRGHDWLKGGEFGEFGVAQLLILLAGFLGIVGLLPSLMRHVAGFLGRFF